MGDMNVSVVPESSQPLHSGTKSYFAEFLQDNNIVSVNKLDIDRVQNRLMCLMTTATRR